MHRCRVVVPCRGAGHGMSGRTHHTHHIPPADCLVSVMLSCLAIASRVVLCISCCMCTSLLSRQFWQQRAHKMESRFSAASQWSASARLSQVMPVVSWRKHTTQHGGTRSGGRASAARGVAMHGIAEPSAHACLVLPAHHTLVALSQCHVAPASSGGAAARCTPRAHSGGLHSLSGSAACGRGHTQLVCAHPGDLRAGCPSPAIRRPRCAIPGGSRCSS